MENVGWKRSGPITGGVEHRTFSDKPLADVLMIARVRASTAPTAKGDTIIYNNMRREREKVFHSRQFGKNGFGWILDLGLLTSLEGAHYMHKSFLDSRDLIDIPEIVRRGIEVNNMVVSRFACLEICDFIAFDIKGSDVSRQPM